MKKDTATYLKEKGIKPSLQRIAIMQYLMDHHTHPTVDEIFKALSNSIPTLSKTTVYNTLTLFAESGACLALTIDDKNLRYDANINLHAHFKCNNCGVVYDMPTPIFTLTEEYGFKIDETEIFYYGFCKNCNK